MRAGRGPLIAAFVVYLVLLTWIILWKLQPPYVGDGALRELKLVPYAAAVGEGASAPLEIAVNILLFVPVGAFLGLLAPRWRWWSALAIVAATSVVFETTQYVLAIGVSDITDVIDNTLGGLLGLGLLAWAQRRARGRTIGVDLVLLIGTAAFLVAVVVFVVSPLRFHSPRT